MVCTFRLCMEDDDPSPDHPPPWYQQSSVVLVNNHGACGNDSCSCGDRYVGRHRVHPIGRMLTPIQQLRVQARRMQVLNAPTRMHFKSSSFYVLQPLNIL